MLYLFLQISYSMLVFTLFLFWSTVFPFKYRTAKIVGRVKSAFIAALIVCFIAPLTSLTMLKDGYFSAFYFANVCTARNPTAFFIAITLHLSMLLWVNSSLLVVIMWKIFKVRPESLSYVAVSWTVRKGVSWVIVLVHAVKDNCYSCEPAS